MRTRFWLVAVVGVIALSGCRPLSLYAIEPQGPPEYKLGWEDGCDTGVAAQQPAIYKLAFGFKKRPEFYNSQLYQTAWNEGFSYCRFSLDPVDKSGAFD